MTSAKTGLAACGAAVLVTLLTVRLLPPAVGDVRIGAAAWRQMHDALREKDARRPTPRGIATSGRPRAGIGRTRATPVTATPAGVSSTLWTTLARLAPLEVSLSAAGSVGTRSSEGDVAHAADRARTAYGITGAGVRVGVLSDSAEAASALIRTGDLPAATTIVQDLLSGRGTSKGTALMEIVHQLAPGAELFFASGLNSPDDFAQNIRVLRYLYRCDVIVDDVMWSGESPFEHGAIAKAVNEVIGSGAIYFSAAGERGNLTSGTSSTWEGDFTSAAADALPGYVLHDFGGVAYNRLTMTTAALDLFWSDPPGASGNDYDLFVLNAEGTAVIGRSTTVQDGDDDPFEEVFSESGFPAGSRVVIAAKAGVAVRALHLSASFNEPLAIATSGAVRGHNALPAVVTVAAVAWDSARTGTGAFTGGTSNPTEILSADGGRRMFYGADGTPITPGSLRFATNGGTVYAKPDLAAADGVTVRTPGFSPFFGTGAAAAQAAGIAALIKSARPSLTPWEIREAMTSTALDIRAPGVDRDAGHGIVMAPAAVAKALQLRPALALTARASDAALRVARLP
jgi:hypothetical protein